MDIFTSIIPTVVHKRRCISYVNSFICLWSAIVYWQSRGRVIIGMTVSQLLVVVQRRHFSTCINNNNVIHLPSADISPSVSSPSGKAVKNATSCFFGSRIFKEEKTTHLAIMHYP